MEEKLEMLSFSAPPKILLDFLKLKNISVVEWF